MLYHLERFTNFSSFQNFLLDMLVAVCCEGSALATCLNHTCRIVYVFTPVHYQGGVTMQVPHSLHKTEIESTEFYWDICFFKTTKHQFIFFFYKQQEKKRIVIT
jgi:hypothetical protein